MLSDVVVQKSIREGFGLVVSETLWKGTPMVAGRAGGIPLQMADGVGGILVDGVDECAAAMRELLADRERVREHFLIPRLVLNHLELMRELVGENPLLREAGWLRKHDPVCGMALGEHPEATVHYRDVDYGCCSTRCRLEFLGAPERYARSQ
jgi:trehalose synthase